MKIERPKKEILNDAEEDVLPEDNDVVEDKKENREHALELELAEKRGELKALKGAAGANNQMSLEQTKQLVFADINNLSDEDFGKKYKTSKHAASMTVMDADNRQTKAEARQLHAEATATSALSAEFGADFYKFKNQILEDVVDLSETARQDPEKLGRWMKDKYLSLSRDEGKPLTKKTDDRRKVVSDFEKPTIEDRTDKEKRMSENDEIPDEVPAESDISNQKLGRLMGITSEKERKALSEKNLIYVDMDLGDRWHFGDPKRGFERKEQKVA